MPSSTLSLECSRLIFDLVGEYECERHWFSTNQCKTYNMGIAISETAQWCSHKFPAPTFSEVIREVLPKISEKMKWDESYRSYRDDLVDCYCYASTEPEAMSQVESYLLKLLK